MIDDDRLRALLRSAMPPATAAEPSRDLWPLVAHRPRRRPNWSRLDLGLALAAAFALMLVPQGWLLLAYHF
jgi:hypothetical protein